MSPRSHFEPERLDLSLNSFQGVSPASLSRFHSHTYRHIGRSGLEAVSIFLAKKKSKAFRAVADSQFEHGIYLAYLRC